MLVFILGAILMYIPALILIDSLFDYMEESGKLQLSVLTLYSRIILAVVLAVVSSAEIVQMGGGF